MKAEESQERKPFYLFQSVLTSTQCQRALRKVYEFQIDTWNGKLKEGFESNSNDVQNCCGAGWLLGDIRELLAKEVFEPRCQTHMLHTSKEGFRCIRLENLDTGPVTCSSDDFNVECWTGETSKSPSMAIMERAFVVLSTGPASKTMTCRVSPLQEPASSSVVQLSAGDVLIYHSDQTVTEEYHAGCNQYLREGQTTKNSLSAYGVAMYCAMRPVTANESRTRTLWNTHLKDYKQRRTASILQPIEDGRRCYFRAAPPIVTVRQAELYGLLPYMDPSDDSSLRDKDLTRAKIRGVLFWDIGQEDENDYEHLAPPIGPVCPVSSVQLGMPETKGKGPNLMAGQDKYLGGMASPCGRYIYGVPGTAKCVLRIHTATGQMDGIGPDFIGKFKWLRGVEIPPPTNPSSSEYPKGCCIALPCNSLSFLKVNPASDHVYNFGNETLQGACEGVNGWYYHGGNLSSINGWIYCIPANANRVAKLHPFTDEVVLIGPNFDGPQKWYGGLVGSDGCIYGIPHNATTVLKIDPRTDEVSLLEGTNTPLPKGNWKWHGGLVAGHKIIGFPNNADSVLIIDCEKSTIYTIGDETTLKSGRHRIPQDGRYKYLGGALTKDGRYAYLFPCDAERVLRIDVEKESLSLVGPLLLDGENKFQNGFAARDGCLYGIPQRAVGVLRISPGVAADGSDDEVDIIPCGENMIGVKDKFEGGVLGHDGNIYCIPLRARVCVKIIPGE